MQEMLISGLLHDTVEDTEVISFADIGRLFGAGCQRIVEGETKFSKLSKLQQGTSQEELKVLFFLHSCRTMSMHSRPAFTVRTAWWTQTTGFYDWVANPIFHAGNGPAATLSRDDGRLAHHHCQAGGPITQHAHNVVDADS
jgi:hypothetical protein